MWKSVRAEWRWRVRACAVRAIATNRMAPVSRASLPKPATGGLRKNERRHRRRSLPFAGLIVRPVYQRFTKR
jgi:hypothetical protein